MNSMPEPSSWSRIGVHVARVLKRHSARLEICDQRYRHKHGPTGELGLRDVKQGPRCAALGVGSVQGYLNPLDTAPLGDVDEGGRERVRVKQLALPLEDDL